MKGQRFFVGPHVVIVGRGMPGNEWLSAEAVAVIEVVSGLLGLRKSQGSVRPNPFKRTGPKAHLLLCTSCAVWRVAAD